MAARACSGSLGRAKSLLRPARSGEIAAQACSVGLAGALDFAAQAYLDEERCFLVAGRSKSLLELSFYSARRPLSARSHCSIMLLFPSRPLSARKHCSSTLLFPSEALSSILFCSSKALSIMLVFPSKSLSKSLCFELCLASSCTLCDFTGTVRCQMRI